MLKWFINTYLTLLVFLKNFQSICLTLLVSQKISDAQALIWSKMSTGLPIEISSSMKSQNYVTFCRLDIDIHRYPLNT